MATDLGAELGFDLGLIEVEVNNALTQAGIGIEITHLVTASGIGWSSGSGWRRIGSSRCRLDFLCAGGDASDEHYSNKNTNGVLHECSPQSNV